jgi:hypothetical protein
MKLIRLIKMCLNKTYSKVRVGKQFSNNYNIKIFKTKRCLIAAAFQFFLQHMPVGTSRENTGCYSSKRRGSKAYDAMSSPESGQNRCIKTANTSFENVPQLRYSGTTVI